MKYIKREYCGFEIDGQTYDGGMISFVNSMCIQNMSTYKGRLDASKVILNRSSNLPVYVNENICLFPTESIRNYGCFLVNVHQVLHVKSNGKKSCIIIFYDLSVIKVSVSKVVIDRQLTFSRCLIDF